MKGKVTNQYGNAMDQNIIASIGMEIASFLGSQDPHLYTSNRFRRTGNTRISHENLKLGGLPSVCERYIENSL